MASLKKFLAFRVHREVDVYDDLYSWSMYKIDVIYIGYSDHVDYIDLFVWMMLNISIISFNVVDDVDRYEILCLFVQ